MAATLYPDDAPNDFQPVTCYGDGNCLFRAFSMIFFGNEDHHTEFRIRAVCELVKNEKNYLSNDYLHSLTGVNKVVENLLPSSVVVNAKDFSSSYRRDILRTLKPFTFAHMWHIFSLANVLGCTVQSVYPDVQNPGTKRSLLNISIRPAVVASNSTQPSVRLMWSNASNSSKRGCGPNHFVPLIPVGTAGLQDTASAWVTVKGKPKRGKRKAESQSPKMATSPSKKKPLNFSAPLDQATSLPTQPSVQPGSPKAKPKDAAPQSKQDTSGTGSPANEGPKKEKQPSVQPKAKPKDAAPQCKQDTSGTGSPANEGPKKEKQPSVQPKAKPKDAAPHTKSKHAEDTSGAGSPANEGPTKRIPGAAGYNCVYKKAWKKEWSFITAANDPHSFHCAVCSRDVSCKHQGRADVERHINKNIHQNNVKRIEGQNKHCRLVFRSW